MDDQLTEDKVSQFKETFSLFDKDGDGTVTIGELGIAMRSLGRETTEAEILYIIKEVDRDGDNAIDFPEFLIMNADKIPDMESNERIEGFKAFDKDDNGIIDAGEMKQLITSMGGDLTDTEAEVMIQEADLNGDGEVTYDEFSKMMLSG